MPAGMKPLEKFLKKQTTALTRAGGFVGGVADKASGGTGASRRRASLSRVVPFFRETSPESGQAREVFSPDSEDPPSWPSATGPGVPAPGSANGSGDVRSPSLSSDEQSSEASLITESGGGGGSGGGTPLPPDTPDNLTLALLDSAAGKRSGICTGETGNFRIVSNVAARKTTGQKEIVWVGGCGGVGVAFSQR
ncbi:hypothetical protein EPR50_G00164500 [Perca flavescens]|uniref:Uncharacterized protein n=1 Tax=Perca flavescens TaxID=8167 RepID=A0A484CIC5_PERFV|nr:hypothetical protein EPR50_G00164500 [Perca flavescens]